ncbi:hypothetical protein [Streptomyces noursei]|uniref:hypothetical protein n=1 Tax=Streptomyces noursei TaxID=1971 RepID=UPI0016737A1B|nr:hypothetical protein [Streptomyces noursei]MCZ1021238.1 hypothetical protein [Streptomyces noursei]GGX53156.1 hypothetical protein GCM10010341_88070 [Streptomyces noursei]
MSEASAQAARRRAYPPGPGGPLIARGHVTLGFVANWAYLVALGWLAGLGLWALATVEMLPLLLRLLLGFTASAAQLLAGVGTLVLVASAWWWVPRAALEAGLRGRRGDDGAAAPPGDRVRPTRSRSA